MTFFFREQGSVPVHMQRKWYAHRLGFSQSDQWSAMFSSHRLTPVQLLWKSSSKKNKWSWVNLINVMENKPLAWFIYGSWYIYSNNIFFFHIATLISGLWAFASSEESQSWRTISCFLLEYHSLFSTMLQLQMFVWMTDSSGSTKTVSSAILFNNVAKFVAFCLWNWICSWKVNARSSSPLTRWLPNA